MRQVGGAATCESDGETCVDCSRNMADPANPNGPAWSQIPNPACKKVRLFTPPSVTRGIRTGHSFLVESTLKTARRTLC